MLQSFIVYGFLGLSLWCLGTIAARREKINLYKGQKVPFFSWEIVFALLLFALISGIRWNVGTDHLNYLRNYQDLLRGWDLRRDNYETGYVLISNFFAYLGFHFTINFAFFALLQLFLIYYAFRDERYLLPYLGLLIVFGEPYLMWMNGIRQAVAACLFVFSIKYIIEKSLIKYVLVILLATTFHKSAIFLLLFYFLPNINYFNNSYITIALLFLAVAVGTNPYWLSATDHMANILSYIGYEKYADNLYDIIEDRRRDMAFGPRRLVGVLLSIAIIWYFPKVYKLYNNKRMLFCFNLAIIGALYYNLFANAGALFLRLIYYFAIFTTIIASYVLVFLSRANYRATLIRFLIVFVISTAYLTLAIIAESDQVELGHVNYKFFWDY
jgi:hypothetical protein